MTQKELIEEYKRISEIDDIDRSKAYKCFKTSQKHYASVQDGIANPDNFFDNTVALFEEVTKPKRKADFESDSGSRYWYRKDGLIRGSNHWGNRVANCDWALKLNDGSTVYGESAYAAKTFTSEKFGFVKWEDFILKSELIEIKGEEVLTTFANKIGRDYIKHKGKTYQKNIVITYTPVD